MRTPLQKDEQVLLVTHTSWVSLTLPFLIMLAGFAAAYFMGFLQWGWAAGFAGFIYFLIAYFTWEVNIWVVTNYRVIDEGGLLGHFAKESPLDKINNVSYDQTVAGRVFNYGHVEIQTAAEIGATDYYKVQHPKRLKDTITMAQAGYRHLQFKDEASQMATYMNTDNQTGGHDVASQMEKLFELKQKGVLSEDEYNKAKSKLLG